MADQKNVKVKVSCKKWPMANGAYAVEGDVIEVTSHTAKTYKNHLIDVSGSKAKETNQKK